VALYPNCQRSGNLAWSTRIPVLILIGQADDWTPAAACEQMIAGARGRSAAALIGIYSGAYHDFDVADVPLHERTALPIRRARPAASIAAPTRPLAPTPSSACRSGSRGEAHDAAQARHCRVASFVTTLVQGA
jgi:dienelactone hydrolase